MNIKKPDEINRHKTFASKERNESRGTNNLSDEVEGKDRPLTADTKP
jgi:hypothetical protein